MLVADLKLRPGKERLFKLRPKKKADSTNGSANTHFRKVLDKENHDPSKQLDLDQICTRIVALAQVMMEMTFYPYQVRVAYRIVESLLLHDGDVITSLMARQVGKTQCVGGTVAACAVMLPDLARKFPNDWRLNITDDSGTYRGFAHGLNVGIYAPRQDQSAITFDRVRTAFETKSAKKVLKELGLSDQVNNGNTVELSNGSAIRCDSASEQSKIEGATHHLVLAEEAQDISDMKIRKSIHPMVASTLGTIVKIGTANTKKCDFYTSIQENRRIELINGKQNHFFFPWKVCAKFNSMYRKFIEQEKRRIGEDSDEFRMSYNGEWIFERGMFITQDVLFNPNVAIVNGLWSEYHWDSFPGVLKHMPLIAGIDWGQSSDPTSLCLMAVDWQNPIETGETYNAEGIHRYTHYKKHIIGWMEFLGDNYEYQFGEIYSRLMMLPNLRKIIMDSNTCGKPLYDRASAVYSQHDILVEPFNFQAKLKSSGYQLLASDLWSGRLTFPAGPEARKGIMYRKFVQQMLDLRKEYKNNIMHVAHPEERGAHDDMPDAAMLCNWGAATPFLGGVLETSASNPFL